MGSTSARDLSPSVHATAIVEEGAMIGSGSRIWHHAQVRAGARIGRDCVLGKNVFVDEGVSIGDGVKVQNNVSVYQGVVIEDHVFVGPSAVFTNDRVPRADSASWEVVRTVVRSGASIGANATIVAGIEIGRRAMVAAGAVVTTSVGDHTLVVGNPARPVSLICDCAMTRIPYAPETEAPGCERCGSPADRSGPPTERS